MSKPPLDEIRRDLRDLPPGEIVVFGSWCADAWTPRSDVDVAIITRERDRRKNARIWWELLGRAPDRYDLRVFELLPLHVQADIAAHHTVVTGDPGDIGEYFHPIHRRWGDVRHRYEPPLPARERLARLRSAQG